MNEPFAMIELRALADSSLSQGTRVLLAVVCCYAGSSRFCFPSIGLLAEKTGTSRPRVFDRLKTLEDNGYIRREQRPGKSTVIYVLKGLPEYPRPVTKIGTGSEELPVTKMVTGGVTKTVTGTRNQNGDTENTNKKIPLKRAESPDGAASDADTLLYREGKAVLGAKSGGLITRLKAAFGIDEARRLITTASTKENPAEYLNGALRRHRREIQASECRL